MSSSKRYRLLASLIAAALVPTGLLAQEGGTVTGRVIDGTTNQPLTNVQISIEGTALNTLTNQEGRYILLNVPVGPATVNANSLGYTSGEAQVTVTAGGTATADFTLEPSAVALEEIVVTGTAGASERREQPAVIATIDAAEKLEKGTSTSLQDLITAQVPGVSITSSSGVTGTAQQIRIRGASSITLSNEPLVFIDGIKTNSRTLTDINIGGQGVSQLFNLNPEDIQSIEIVKGPAAATLYGADASAGVIQIFTKQGRLGSNRFTQNISVEYQSIDPNFTPPANFGACSAERAAAGSGFVLCEGLTPGTIVSDSPLERNNAFDTGNFKSIGYSGRGGGDNYGYFVSLGWDEEIGTLPNNSMDRRTGRVNFNFVPTSELSFEAGLGLGLSERLFPINDNNIFGYLGGGLLGSPLTVTENENGVRQGGFYIPQRDLDAISSIESQIETLRYAPTLQVNYTPADWFTNRLVMGADISRTEGTQYFPKNDEVWYGGDTDTGDLEEERINFDIYTFDYLGTVGTTFGAEDEFSADISLGFQAIMERLDNVVANGTGFVTNANRVVSSAAQISAGQDFEKTTQIGYLGQVDFGLWDRLFIQAGARIDQFSSFGAEADPFFLPQIGVSYVLSDEEFWEPLRSAVPTLRLRGAFGTTGRAPTAGASLETYDAQPFTIIATNNTGAGVVPARPGNFDLKPEKGTEYELGLDAGFLGQRVGAEVTYFHKKTTDLILEVPIPPSSGFDDFPFRNIGEVLNEGWEIALRGTPVLMDNFAWDFRIAASTLHNELVDLGINPAGEPLEPFGTLNHFEEGFPLGAFFSHRILDVDTEAGEVLVSDDREFIGNYLPDFQGNFGTTLTLFQNLSVTGQLDWKSDFMIYNNTDQFRDRAFGNSLIGQDPSAVLSEEEILRRFGPFVRADGSEVPFTQVQTAYIQDGSFVRLREVAATFTLPQAWADRLMASSAAITLGGRNLHIWTDYPGFDPEVLAQATRNTGQGTFQREDFLTVPQPRRWVAKLNLSF